VAGETTKVTGNRAVRADARRNRARVLEVAAEVFAAEGLSVPVHEIARRAGVGTGTVSRHFPTKEDLFAAILLDRMRQLVDQADAWTQAQDPGTAFFTFFTTVAQEGAAHRGLAEALAGAGYDLDSAAAAANCDVSGRMRHLLLRAQRAGAVRKDVQFADIKALLAGCLAREDSDPKTIRRLVTVITDGLRAGPTRTRRRS
jgi:AcrR family transcriptional regulator